MPKRRPFSGCERDRRLVLRIAQQGQSVCRMTAEPGPTVQYGTVSTRVRKLTRLFKCALHRSS